MAGRLTIVGLGPAGPELITPQVTERLAAAPTVRLRTARHPAAAVVDAAWERVAAGHTLDERLGVWDSAVRFIAPPGAIDG